MLLHPVLPISSLRETVFTGLMDHQNDLISSLSDPREISKMLLNVHNIL